MAHRMESIASGACRRLNASVGATTLRAGRSYTSGATTSLSKMSSRIRPTSALTHHANNASSHCRSFHVTATMSDESKDGAAEAASTPATSPKVEELFQKIIWLDMVEVHLLAELINEKLGVKISDAEKERMARGGGGGSKSSGDDDAKEEVKEEKTAFDLKLTGFDAKAKIKVIKEIRAITALGLKEAKELVEGAPTTVKKNIKMEEAEALKKKLEEIGATVEIV